MPIPAAALFAASSALSMMQGVAGYQQAMEQADAQNEMVRRTNELNRKNAFLALSSIVGFEWRHSSSSERESNFQILIFTSGAPKRMGGFGKVIVTTTEDSSANHLRRLREIQGRIITVAVGRNISFPLALQC